ncbi:MAG: hypothetical protein ACFCUO_04430 [Rhodospirillales bacterium]
MITAETSERSESGNGRACRRIGGRPMSVARAAALLAAVALFSLSLAFVANGAWQNGGGMARAYLPPEPSCKDFVAAETIVWSANRYWLGGFLSAYNMLSRGNGNLGGDAAYEEMVRWLVDHCGKQPELSFLDAVTALVAALERHNR